MRRIPIAFVARSVNEKTGDVPTAWVGRTLAQARESCKGCALLESGDCYAQYGTPAIGVGSIRRKAARDKSWRRYSVDRALADRSKDAKMVRFSAIGDCSRANRRELHHAFTAVRRAGLAIVGYTHFWRTDGRDLRGRLMASCNTIAEASEANAAGWRAAIVAPMGTTGTLRNADGSILAVECPAIAASRLGKRFTCNDCATGKRGALCDASTNAPNVYFADHGPQARRRLKVLQANAE